jgi:tetratricopeptide (TPR) repeat protein
MVLALRIVAIAFAVAGSIAQAKPVREDPLSRDARSAYEEGITEYNLGHFAEALVAFERGYRVKHDPAFLFNIGQCQRQLHKSREAAQSYRAFLRESPTAPNRAEVERLAATMDQEVAREAANQPPMGVTPPADATPRTEVVVVTQPPPPPPPPKRRTGLWIGLGVGGAVVIGLAVGLGVGLSSTSNAPAASLGTMTVTFR